MPTDVRGNPTADATAGGLTPAEHLRAEIERLGLDQVAVSEATGVSRQSINYIVNGRQPISRAMAAKLGRLTGHEPDYWLRASFPRPGGAIVAEDKPTPAAAPARATGVLVNHQIIRAVTNGSSSSIRSTNRTCSSPRSISRSTISSTPPPASTST